jgi:hypothetical protein
VEVLCDYRGNDAIQNELDLIFVGGAGLVNVNRFARIRVENFKLGFDKFD